MGSTITGIIQKGLENLHENPRTYLATKRLWELLSYCWHSMAGVFYLTNSLKLFSSIRQTNSVIRVNHLSTIPYGELRSYP